MTNSELFKIREQDTRLAIAMGWRKLQLHNKEQFFIIPPDWEDTRMNRLDLLGRALCELVPYFHEDHNAKHMLLTWMAKDEVRWEAFVFQFYLAGPEGLRSAFLADPAVVATAADRALRETGHYVEMEK